MRLLAGRSGPYLLLLAEILLFFRKVLFVPGFVIPWDIRGYHLPIAWFTAESLRAWELPLWDPSVYCGRPLYANLTTQLFYPPTIAALLIHNLTAPGSSDALLYVLEWQLVLHVFAGGCFTYWLARELGLDTVCSLAAATAFQLGAFFSSQTQHLGAINAACYLPLVWWSLLRFQRSGAVRWAAVTAIALSMVFLAGFPAVTSAVFGFAAIFGALHGWRTFAAAIAALAASLVLSAVQLLPTLELTGLSVARYRMDWMGTGGGIPAGSLWTLLSPNHFGVFDLKTFRQPHDPTFLYLYSGLTVLALAALALWRRPAFVWRYALLTAAGLLWMLGDSTPLGRVGFVSLPDFLKSAIYLEFAMVAFSLALAVLCGYGLAAIPARWRWPVLAAVAMDLILVSSSRPINTAWKFENPGIGEAHVDGVPEVLQTIRKLTGSATPPYRIDTVEESMDWAMGAPITAVPTASGNDPFALDAFMTARRQFVKGERWGRYYEVGDLTSPMLDFMNVRYVLSRNPIDDATLDQARFRAVATLPGRLVYENLEVRPRFSVEPGGTVTASVYRGNRVVLETTAPGPATLITSEAAYPGWRVFVDGSETAFGVAHGAFRSVALPAGRHTVEMRFEPSILRKGAWISLAALLILGFLAARR